MAGSGGKPVYWLKFKGQIQDRETGVNTRGRSCYSRGRVSGERSPALQEEGAVGRHHQGNQEAQLLHEAWGKASSQGSPFTQTPPQKATARAGLVSRAVW